MLYEHILSKSQALDTQIQTLKTQLASLPPGKLICCSHGKYVKWFQSDGRQKIYISKSNPSLAEQLAQKKYLSLLLEDLENEKNALALYLKHRVPGQQAEQLLTQPSEYQKLLTHQFSSKSNNLSEYINEAHESNDSSVWMNSPYEYNTSHPETLTCKTISGSFVRSKSELLIDLCLRNHNIPFRYECALHLDDITIYPDFTLKHPITQDIFYWEHFGMMDNPSYLSNATAKLRLYASHGIIPGIHLITTYETKEHPLDFEYISKTINLYFGA